MSILNKRFGSKAKEVKQTRPDENKEVIPVPIPALVALLLRAEQLKGSPLNQEEVIRIRDEAICMTMTIEMKLQLEEKRGYPDLDPEFAWEQWQVARLELSENAP